MKRRNLILAFVLIGLFLAAGRLYFRTYVRQKPFAVILFVTEGLTPARLAAARQYSGGSDNRLGLEYLPKVALLRSSAADYAVGDGAATASAIATGTRTNLRAVAIDPAGRMRSTLVDLARVEGRSTGLVTDVGLAEGGAAAFYARSPDVREAESIARQLTDGRKFEVILGGGAGDFRDVMKGGRRQDSRDLDRELQGAGYSLARNAAELDAIPAWTLPRVAGLLGDDLVPDALPLSDLVRRAIQYLEKRPGGYFLVVHAGASDRAALMNGSEAVLQRFLELDRAVATAQQYAGARTLLIAAGLHETGGFALNGYPLRSDRGVALLGINPTSNLPAITWATGPNGRQPVDTAAKQDPAASFSLGAVGTVSDALVFAAGEGSESIGGVMEPGDLFELIRREL